MALDEDDSEPQQFFSYLALAVQEMVGIGQSLSNLLQSPQAIPAKSLVMAFINDVTDVPSPFFLILDDYHHVKSAELDQAMAYLLDHMPPQLHLILTSRRDPGFPLSRLRVQSQMTEIRAEHLRFTVVETSTFLEQVMGLSLAPEQITALEERTEGWVAGLQMAALSMQNRDDIASFVDNFTGSNRFVIDYLTDEVLEQIPPELQDFLLQTSILTRLSASLCTAVIGDSESEGGDVELVQNIQHNLDYLEQANLFLIPLDDNRTWYRYHHLFVDLLQKRLQQRRRHQAPALHQRASRWYEEHGLITDALYHARSARDFDRATQLIATHTREAIAQGNSDVVFAWINAMPERLVRSHPMLAVGKAWFLLSQQQLSPIESYLSSVEEALGDRDDVRSQEHRGEAYAIRALAARYGGEGRQAVVLCRQALSQLSTGNAFARSVVLLALSGALRAEGETEEAIAAYLDTIQQCARAGNLLALMGSVHQLHELHVECGRLRDAEQLLLQSLETHRQYAELPVAGLIYAARGSISYERNDLDESKAQLQRVLPLSQSNLVLLLIQIKLAQIALFQGNRESAESLLGNVEDALQGWQQNEPATNLRSHIACIAIWQGDLAPARHWQRAAGVHIPESMTYTDEFPLLVLARLFIVEGRLNPPSPSTDEALTLLDRIEQTAAAAGRFGRVMEAQILQALAYDGSGKPTEALQQLKQALVLAETEGYVRTFVDEGEPMAVLLRRLEDHPYAARLLAAFPNPLSSVPRSRPSSSLVEPLSERELEVLRLIADGLKYREIADQLIVSLNTVRSHMKNIYGKLGVNNRTQAIAKARELGLL